MARNGQLFGGVILLTWSSGCALQEVRSKTKFGPEYQHSGSDSTDSVRYSEEQGIDFMWGNDWTTGVSYRRRDTDNGNGNNDNGVWFDFSFPIWKRPKAEAKTAERIEALERRLAEVEAAQAERLAGASGAARDESVEGSERRVAQVKSGTIPNAQNETRGE